MDDARCKRFFTDANSSPSHRQYEALRAVFLDGRSQKEVAETFGYSHGSMRQLKHGFRKSLDEGACAPFSSRPLAADATATRSPSP